MAALLAALIAAPVAQAITIEKYYYDYGAYIALSAEVTWDPLNPGNFAGDSMYNKPRAGEPWVVRNGGVDFLDIIREGQNLRFETWGTDTNGNYGSDYIDIFSLPIGISGAFPKALWGLQVPSDHGWWTYLFSPLKNNAHGFRVTAGYHVSESTSTVGLLGAALAGLGLSVRFRRRAKSGKG